MGVVANDPDQPIELKAFHRKIIQDKAVLDKEKAAYLHPHKVRTVTQETIGQNYEQIKQDVHDIEQAIFEEILNDPAKQHLVIKNK